MAVKDDRELLEPGSPVLAGSADQPPSRKKTLFLHILLHLPGSGFGQCHFSGLIWGQAERLH